MSYKDTCKKLKINYKKDLSLSITIVSLFVLGGIAAYIFYDKTIGILAAGFGFVYFFVHMISINGRKTTIVYSKEIAFNGFYRYVVSLLSSGHILYSALKASLEYVDSVLEDDVNELICAIEEDTSLQPFIDFMGNFNDDNIKQMIILLYKTSDAGNITDVIDSINQCMVNLQDNAIKEYVKKETNKINAYFYIPLLLSAVVIILITLYVFQSVGGDLIV